MNRLLFQYNITQSRTVLRKDVWKRVINKHVTAAAHENLNNQAKLDTNVKTTEYDIKCPPYAKIMHRSLSTLIFQIGMGMIDIKCNFERKCNKNINCTMFHFDENLQP